MAKLFGFFLTLATIIILSAFLSGCPGKLSPSVRPTNTISNSEVAEAVASGVVNATASNGSEARYIPRNPQAAALSKMIASYLTLISKAEAAVSLGQCPTPQNSGSGSVFAPNAVCGTSQNTLGQQIMTLTWAPCNGVAPLGTWSGGMTLTLTTSPGNTVLSPAPGSCPTFPPFQAGDVVTRTFLSPSGRINNYTLNPNPTDGSPYNPVTGQDIVPVTVLVDTYAASIVPVPNPYPLSAYSGYASPTLSMGETITYTGAVTRNITINGIHLKGSIGGYITWDYTVSTAFPGQPSVAIAVNGANAITSGKLYVQDNIVGRTTLTDFAGGAAYTNGCGVPTGGTISTAGFSGVAFTTETLVFTGCGTATLNLVPTYLFHAF